VTSVICRHCGGYSSGGNIPSEIQEPKAPSHASTAKLSTRVKLSKGICPSVKIAAVHFHPAGGKEVGEEAGNIEDIFKATPFSDLSLKIHCKGTSPTPSTAENPSPCCTFLPVRGV
jgi:hypothetical protein